MARGNAGRIYEVIETGKLAYSYNREQAPEFAQKRKVLVYVSEISQLSLFEDLPPKEHCRRVLKDADKLKLVGFID
jgi:predicted nucleotidyltransferase